MIVSFELRTPYHITTQNTTTQNTTTHHTTPHHTTSHHHHTPHCTTSHHATPPRITRMHYTAPYRVPALQRPTPPTYHTPLSPPQLQPQPQPPLSLSFSVVKALDGASTLAVATPNYVQSYLNNVHNNEYLSTYRFGELLNATVHQSALQYALEHATSWAQIRYKLQPAARSSSP